ncbi:ATP-dependent RNA helicase RhlB [Desulfurivibrio alkaliphilus]|uniref:DEAD/DEAH box helicase domain protein n=1 Tax=Desulfurivibrio alkaliphilus (strain DSM 19089 / UNIQEM U267 / AHT2) TaxID=589865 RepID=D6Z2Z3_DESAT|nr:ATP-dependent RNA helicase RhlB [Desulfurivibrio alkaliphilus]ADH85918.1 DEAD/DEAH box helicase domain protein [Desulfurivibrio alkaliphilus AHT 2]
MISKLIQRIRRRLRTGSDATAQTDHKPADDTLQTADFGAIATGAATSGETDESRPQKRRRRRKRKPKADQPATADQAATTPEAANWSLEDFQVPPAEGKTRFHDLDLPQELMRAIHASGFQYCTPIQAEILPPTLAGHDAFGKAQTGTGKSAAFLISIITRLLREPDTVPRQLALPKALILAPTRELAIQIHRDAEELTQYSELNCVAVFGGTDYEKQRKMFEQAPVDLLIATPGRLLDFARQKVVSLKEVRVLVIDEADRLLDMGFIPDVRRIIQQTPEKSQRQTLFFSATLNSQIANLSAQWTKDPVTVEIEPEQVASDRVEQRVYMVTAKEKMTVLYNLITGKQLERVIVFCNRRDVTRRVRERLYRHGISCAMLSGEVSQQQRMKTLDNFKEGKIRVLVATDVAGRGLHIEGISHVINYNLPEDAEDYVHRIGRTGRAGASGISVSFADEEESFYLPAIEEYMGRKLDCVYPEDELLIPLPPPVQKAPPVDKNLSGNQGGRSGKPGRKSGPPRRSSNSGRPRRS